jgi:hypothetical protein
MTVLRRDTELGSARAVAADAELAALAIEHCASLLATPADGATRSAGPVRLGPGEAWVKAGTLRGKARLRHGLRRALLARVLPREAEYRNLTWLAERRFRVPRPLAAASIWRGGLPLHQAVFLELLHDARPLHAELPSLPPAERAELLDELAREVARLHALGFAHHDLYLRNVLVLDPREGDQRRLAFIDAWSGGPGRARRGPARDLACLMLEGANLLTADEQARWLERYLAEREAHGRPAEAAELVKAAAGVRKTLLARIARESGRWRLSEPPRGEWSWPLGESRAQERSRSPRGRPDS